MLRLAILHVLTSGTLFGIVYTNRRAHGSGNGSVIGVWAGAACATGRPERSALNAGSCNTITVQLSPECFYGLVQEADRGEAYRVCLTSAICNQLIASLADETPWRVCACEGCGRVFKRKQTKASSPNCDSVYCCDPCMERQKKRNQRAAAKNRIQH